MRVAVVVAGGLLLAGAMLFLLQSHMAPRNPKAGARWHRKSSSSAFNESYLNAVNGKITTRRNDCRACHPTTDARTQQNASRLNGRASLSREAWADEIPLQAKCGACHLVPDPSNLPGQSWREVMSRMAQIME